MEYGFIGGSMGVVVGEKITRGIERAIARQLPVIIVSCSGGARMMEGALSLMQMAKISSALARLDRARLPYISLLTDPTTGGVTASFAMLGDLNIAEPKALIGFAGPRVIEQTIRQTLPEGFQRSEFLLERGMLDIVVDRRELKDLLTRVLRFGIPSPTRVPAVPPRPGSHASAVRRCRGAADRRVRGADRTVRLNPARSARSMDSLALSLQPRTARDEVRPREHDRAVRGARQPEGRIPVGHRRRHQRQGIGHGDAPRRRSHAAGHRVGRYTSPHLERLEERFVIDEREVDTGELRAAADDVQRRPSGWSRTARLPGLPTFFECATAIAFELFRAPRGRRLPCSRSASAAGSTPPTSSLPIAAAITSIDFDHQAQLGDDLDVDRPGEGRHHQAGDSGRAAGRCRRTPITSSPRRAASRAPA